MLFRISFVFLFFVILLSPVFAQPDSLNLTLVAEWQPEDTSKMIEGFDVSNEYLYVSTYREMHVIDVSNPSSPIEVSELVTGDSLKIAYLTTTDSFLYAAYYDGSGINRLAILDISCPTSPYIIYIGDGDIASHIKKLCPYSDSTDNYIAWLDLDLKRVSIANVTDPSSPFNIDWADTVSPDTGGYYNRYYNIAVRYPNLIIVGMGSECIDDSVGWFEDWYFVKKWDMTALDEPALEWTSVVDDYGTPSPFYWGIGDSIIFGGRYRTGTRNIILRYNESEIESICTIESDRVKGIYSSSFGDTFYIRTLDSTTLMVLKIHSDCCEIETLGYYNLVDDTITHPLGVSEIIIAKEGNIFVRSRDDKKIYILSWTDDQIEDQGYLDDKIDYRIYPSPIVFGNMLVLNRPINKASNIYDTSGKMVKNIPQNQTRINISNIPPGLYFLISNDREVKLKFIIL